MTNQENKEFFDELSKLIGKYYGGGDKIVTNLYIDSDSSVTSNDVGITGRINTTHKIIFNTINKIKATPKRRIMHDSTYTDILTQALNVIEDYLNAGDKESRKKASKKGKAVYKRFHGKDYKNR